MADDKGCEREAQERKGHATENDARHVFALRTHQGCGRKQHEPGQNPSAAERRKYP